MPVTMPTQYHDETLKMLNRYFRTTSFEKHPKAMLSIIFDQAMTKVLGKDFAKKRISQRKQKKLYEAIVNRLRSCYGKYINLLDFKAKDPAGIKFITNFSEVYKTEFGTLFGIPSYNKVYESVFFTHHCFERFEERVDLKTYEFFDNIVQKNYYTDPTAADVLMHAVMLNCGQLEYGIEDNFCHLNIGIGILVLEDFQEFYVAKTFLAPSMAKPNMKWKAPLMTPEQEKSIGKSFGSLKALLNNNPIPIKGPLFVTGDVFEELGYV